MVPDGTFWPGDAVSLFPNARNSCPHRRNPARCIQRQSWTPQSSDCRACEFLGRGGQESTDSCKAVTALDDKKAVLRGTIREVEEKLAERKKSMKEESMEQETIRNGILRVLERKGAMSVSILKNFTAARAPKKEFQFALDELARTGKINTKAGIREGSLKVWLSGAPDSRGPVAEKAPAQGEKKIGRLTEKKTPAVAVPGSPPQKNGGRRTRSADPLAVAIEELKSRRETIGRAIKALEEAMA